MSGAAHAIGAAVMRLDHDYDAALREANYDESVIAFYLPSEWVILARRVCQLIMSETRRAYTEGELRARSLGAETCSVCQRGLFCVSVDPDGRRRLECANCGQASHV